MFNCAHTLLVTSYTGTMSRCRLLLQKKQTANAYAAAAGKVGGEEKWAQAAMEYIYEKRHVNDSRKRQYDVERERSVSSVFDKYCAISDKVMEDRFGRLITRMNEALEALKELNMLESLDEAVMLNSEQPPCNLRHPTLTPPLANYEPGFGLDVPQLRNQHSEYPPIWRPTDQMQFGQNESEYFPFVEVHRIEDLTKACTNKLENIHGVIREECPLTGVEGEAWEAYVALQKKALARQQLILDLHNDPELSHKYNSDDNFRKEELRKRGIVQLEIESDITVNENEKNSDAKWHYGSPESEFTQELHRKHFAQVPAYEPFRSI